MKSFNLAIIATAVTVAVAQPHQQHGHQHLHKEKRQGTVTTVVPGPTVNVYVFKGHPISEEEVKEGIRNGTMVYANGNLEESEPVSAAAITTSVTSVVSVASEPSSYGAPSQSSEDNVSSTSESDTSTKTSTPVKSDSSSATSSPAQSPTSYGSDSDGSSSSSSSSGSGFGSSAKGVEKTFPDGEIDCDTFPSDYGALAVDWVGLGGWTGVQDPSSNVGGYSRIMTANKKTCSGSNCCTEGSFCSYACPDGYQKTQWPTTQGSTGQSVGGITCTNGKLRLTNKAMSDKLCMPGVTKVEVLVKNEMSSNVAVCRTDYPGTEGQTVPLQSLANSESQLTCPDGDKYYNWKGSATSAQYYVNPAGVSIEKGCQWGKEGNDWGNFAPLNLGVGYSAGFAWLSIFQNAPTTDARLDFAIELKGEGMQGKCRYTPSGGQYCSGENYDNCSRDFGCTVSMAEGTAYYVFTDA